MSTSHRPTTPPTPDANAPGAPRSGTAKAAPTLNLHPVHEKEHAERHEKGKGKCCGNCGSKDGSCNGGGHHHH